MSETQAPVASQSEAQTPVASCNCWLAVIVTAVLVGAGCFCIPYLYNLVRGGDKKVATTPASKHVKPAFLVSAEAAGAKTSFNQETGDWSMEWDPAKGPGFKEENACYTDDGSSLPAVITSTWCSLSLVGNGQNANYWVGKPKKCEKEKVLDLTDDEEKAWVNKILKDGKGRDDALAIFKKAASRRSREFFFPSAGGPTGPRSGN